MNDRQRALVITILGLATVAFIGFGVPYLMLAVVHLEANVTEWSQGTREVWMGMGSFFILAWGVFKLLSNPHGQ